MQRQPARASYGRFVSRLTSGTLAIVMAGGRGERLKGLTVNRWTSTAMLAASAASNEVGYLTHKVMRSMGMLAFDNQARV